MVTLITENYQIIVVTFLGGGGGIFYLFVCLFVWFCLFGFGTLFVLFAFFGVFFVFYFDKYYYYFFFENDKIRLLEELMTQNSCVIKLRVQENIFTSIYLHLSSI